MGPNSRNKGVGTILLNKIEVIALENDKKQILPGAKEKAEKFYLKNGFKPMLFVQLEGKYKLDLLKKSITKTYHGKTLEMGIAK